MHLTLALLAAACLAACGAAAPAAPAAGEHSTSSATPNLSSTTVAPTSTPALIAPANRTALAALRGSIQIDGSSTVFPITEAAAAAFRSIAPGVEISLGVSGTGGGFKRFCAGETVISDASRPINANEAAACAASGIAFIELPVAFDGISVVVSGQNSWAECLATEELRRIWEPAAEGRVETWRDVRPAWADRPLNLYGAGGDSGTYDYFD